MLDLEPRIQLDEVERPLRPEQELERAGVAVVDRARGLLGRVLHLLAGLVVERGRRRLLDQLLVPPLDRALALAERQHSALPVGQHLDLDVPRRDDRLLEVEPGLAERGLRLGGGGLERALELVGVADRAACPSPRRPRRPSAAPDSRPPRPRRAPLRASSRLRCPARPGRPAATISCFAAALSPMRAIVSARRPDEDELVVEARLGERRVLGEEAVAGMDRLAARRRRGGDHGRNPQVALVGGGGPMQTARSASRVCSAPSSAVE